MLCLGRADPSCGRLAASAQVRRPSPCVVGIGGQDMRAPLIQHARGPVLGATSESTQEGACSDLHPYAGAAKALNRGVVLLDPRQPLWMGQDRYVASNQQAEEQILQLDGGGVMRRLNENVARIGQRQQLARA